MKRKRPRAPLLKNWLKPRPRRSCRRGSSVAPVEHEPMPRREQPAPSWLNRGTPRETPKRKPSNVVLL